MRRSSSMWEAFATIGLIGCGAVVVYLRLRATHERDWNWDGYEYPARPTGKPSPRSGLNDVD